MAVGSFSGSDAFPKSGEVFLEAFELGLEFADTELDFAIVFDGSEEFGVCGDFLAVGFLEGLLVGGLGFEVAIRKIFGAEEGVDLFPEFASDGGFHLGVGAAFYSLGKSGWVGFGSVAEADDVEDGVAIRDFLAQHLFDGAVVGGEVALLDGMAVDGFERILGKNADVAEVFGSGGDEDVGASGDGHGVGCSRCC